MEEGWPKGYEKLRTLLITTIGRRSGRKHRTTVWFTVDDTGTLYVSTLDAGRDWVRNVLKNPAFEVTIRNVTCEMTAKRLTSDADKRRVLDLYRRKYLLAKLHGLLAPRYVPPEVFELMPQ